MAWVHPWLIALEGEYIRSTLYGGMHVTLYGTIVCMWAWLGYVPVYCSGRRIHKIDPYIGWDYFMYVGVAWVRPWLIALE